MKSLTSRVNLGTGLAHPSGKPAAIWMFRLLKQAGEAYDPNETQAWAASHHWRADHARELADIARKILDGRRVKARGPAGASDIISRRRAEAAGRE